MTRVKGLLLLSVLALAACEPTQPKFGPDGLPLPQVYKITPSDEGKIAYRVLDSANSLRAARGAPPLALNAQLTAAGRHPFARHGGAKPPVGTLVLTARHRFCGHSARVTWERFWARISRKPMKPKTETMSAWMGLNDTRDVILNPEARDLGFAWFQEPSGKIWWTLVTGG